MNKKFSTFGEQALIVFNIFILFLLLFDDKLVMPLWLQPAGRMHTLLLHFPIVLLLLATAMEFFRFSPESENQPFIDKFSRSLLLAATLLAGITVITGLFLSREQGYGGDTLTRHKWTGSVVFFLASLIYWLRKKNWYKRGAAFTGSIIMMLVLVLAGHFGATLTHGENFILQPLADAFPKAAVPLGQAVIFDDVIQPILQKKCTGCHNPGKLKGEMSLTDTLSIMKGGKSGKLYIPGNPDLSLLLERIHLPVDEEKHMPPAGKPQLTADDINLLRLWIKEGGAFNGKLIALSPDDSLRVVAEKRFMPADSSTIYDFPAADEKLILRLNTDYRTVAPEAKESPALEVSFYNRNAYSVKQLQELGEIKKQVTSLSLNKLPVKDEDMKAVGEFKNLRRLELNFTDITSNALALLGPMQQLHTLSLSGDNLSYAGLAQTVGTFPHLRTISVWNSGLTAAEISGLRKKFKEINFLEGYKDDGNEPLKLNPPQVKNAAMVFSGTVAVQLRHPVKGVTIRYTTDGKDPDSIHAPVFENNTVISDNTTIKAKAYKTGWHSSDIAVFDYFKNTFIPDSVQLLLPLNSVHQAEGAQTFFNTRLGVIGANNPAWANYWAGVKLNDLVLVSLFYKPIKLSEVGLHYMVEEATGIFPPASVEVWGGENEKGLKLLTTMRPALPAKGDKPSLKMIRSSFNAHTISYLKIIAKPHVHKKDRHLLLVDELFLN